MNSRVRFDGRIMTVELSGEIDHHGAKSIREMTDSLIQQNRPSELHLDFSMVTFMDSSGIGLIMGRYRMMMLYGGVLRVVNVPQNLERIMIMSGLGALDIFERQGEIYEYT